MHALLPSNDNLKESSAKVVAVLFSLQEKSETRAKFYAYKSLYFLFFIRTTPRWECTVVTVQYITTLLVKFLIYTPEAAERVECQAGNRARACRIACRHANQSFFLVHVFMVRPVLTFYPFQN